MGHPDDPTKAPRKARFGQDKARRTSRSFSTTKSTANAETQHLQRFPTLSNVQPFHKLDETIRGHVFCSFLALVLKTTLEERIAALGHSGSWPDILADLDSLTETEIEYDGKRFIVRSAPRPAASLALRAAGVALPATVRDATAS